MHILIAHDCRLPVHLYGGTERVIWALGKGLAELGHRVTYLVQGGSTCDFAAVLPLDKSRVVSEQIPDDVDVVHLHYQPKDIALINQPYIVTIHGNRTDATPCDRNAVFISQDHAARHGATTYVYNGLDWSLYDIPDLSRQRTYYHFLANAAWKVKNVRGAIATIRKTPAEQLYVLGGVRFNFRIGWRFTWSRRAKFFGMVDGAAKFGVLQGSKGLLFPVRWHEPFGLSIIESMYYGCPVYGTPYGSLPELVPADVGYLTTSATEMAVALASSSKYEPEACHVYARDRFSAVVMAQDYLKVYRRVSAGQPLHELPPTLQATSQTGLLPWRR